MKFYCTFETALYWYPLIEEYLDGTETYREVAERHGVSPRTLSYYRAFFATPGGKAMILKIKTTKQKQEEEEMKPDTQNIKIVGTRKVAKMTGRSTNSIQRWVRNRVVPDGNPVAPVFCSDHRPNAYAACWRDEAHVRAWVSACEKVVTQSKRRPHGAIKVTNNVSNVKEDKTRCAEQNSDTVKLAARQMEEISAILDRMNEPSVMRYRKLMGQPETLTVSDLVVMLLDHAIASWDQE